MPLALMSRLSVLASARLFRSKVPLLDTSVLIDYPVDTVARHAQSAAVSTITLAELAYGLHTGDPLVNDAREQRYQWIVTTFDPIPFAQEAARTYGALCATVRAAERDPKPRRAMPPRDQRSSTGPSDPGPVSVPAGAW